MYAHSCSWATVRDLEPVTADVSSGLDETALRLASAGADARRVNGRVHYNSLGIGGEVHVACRQKVPGWVLRWM